MSALNSTLSELSGTGRRSTTRRTSVANSAETSSDAYWPSEGDAIFTSRLQSQNETPTNASPDQLFSLFISLAADVHLSVTSHDDTVLEQVINRDIGIIDAGTTYIGQGGSFNVRALLMDPPDRSFVLKSVLPFTGFDRIEEKRRLGDVILELRALSHKPLRSHRNIVELLGLAWETDAADKLRKWPVLVLEYADGGNLDDFLHTHRKLTFQQRLSLCLDVARGLHTLHQCAVVHGDMKTTNVLIFRLQHSQDEQFPWVAKLSDFGGSVLDIQLGSLGLLSMGTHPWHAPEYGDWLTRDGLLRTDIYSLGLVICSVMAAGVRPILDDLDTFGLTEVRDEYLHDAVLELKRLDNHNFLDSLLTAGRRRFVKDVDFQLVKKALSLTVQRDPSLRDIDALLLLLEQAIGGTVSTVSQGLNSISLTTSSKPAYTPITMISHIENVLMAKDQADTLGLAILDYVRQRLKDTCHRSPQAEQRSAAAFALGIDAIRKTDESTYIDDCLHWLIRSARYGNQTAQSLVYRFHKSLGRAIPEDVRTNVKEWIISSAHRNYPAAQDDLSDVTSPEECSSVWEMIRTRYAGIGWNRFADLYSTQTITLAEWDQRLRMRILQAMQDPGFTIDRLDLNSKGDNVLHFAASAGFVSTVRLWSRPMPISINSQGADGETALLHACRSGQFEVAKLLLEHRADPRIASPNGDTPLHWLLSFDGPVAKELAVELIAKGAYADASARSVRFEFAPICDYEAGTSLHRAVGRGKIDAVKALLDVGADANDPGGREDGRSAIYLAAQLHYPDILKLLLHSLDVEEPAAMSYAGVSLLAPAIHGDVLYGERFSKIARHGDQWWTRATKTLDVLLDHGASKHLHRFPDGMNCADCTPLFVATAMGLPEQVQYLLDKGCKTDLNKRTYYWLDGGTYTPLVKAIFQCRKDVFKALLDNGADLSIKHIDENGYELPYLYQCAAAGHNDTSFAAALVSRRVPINDNPPGFETAFACAVRNRCFTLAKWLLDHDADPHVEYSKGLNIEMSQPRSLLGFLVKEQTRSVLVCIDWLLKEVPDTRWIVSEEKSYTALHALAAARQWRRDERRVGASEFIADALMKHFKPNQEMLDQKDNDGRTAIWLAVAMANNVLVENLLEVGVDPEIPDRSGVSAVNVNEMLMENLEEKPDSLVDEGDPRPAKKQVESIRKSRSMIRESFVRRGFTLSDL